MKKIIIFFIIFAFIQAAYAVPIEYDCNNYSLRNSFSSRVRINQDTGTLKILFIGSSYFNFNDLPGVFEELVQTSGKNIFVDHYGKNGLFLSDHANNLGTGAKINEQEWDFVILQGVGRNMAYPEYFTDHPVYPALVTLKEKIQKNCEQTKIIYCMPWAFEDGMTWYPGWYDTYEDMQLKIYDTTLNYSKEIDFTIAPVGWAWYLVLKEQGYPLHYLHTSDWNHPSLRGSYLMACVIYSTIYIEPSINISYNASLNEDESKYFQKVSSDIVLNNLSLWNIEEYNENSPPCNPEKPSGPTSIRRNVAYIFNSSTIDVDSDDVFYLFDWGDGNYSSWIGPYGSGEVVNANHSWAEIREYSIRVKAKDVYGAQSEWSEALQISKQKEINSYNFIKHVLEMIRSNLNVLSS